MTIGYLTLAVVRQNLQLLRASRSTVRLCRRYHELEDFLNYFERNYFMEISRYECGMSMSVTWITGPIIVLRVSITSVFAFITNQSS